MQYCLNGSQTEITHKFKQVLTRVNDLGIKGFSGILAAAPFSFLNSKQRHLNRSVVVGASQHATKGKGKIPSLTLFH